MDAPRLAAQGAVDLRESHVDDRGVQGDDEDPGARRRRRAARWGWAGHGDPAALAAATNRGHGESSSVVRGCLTEFVRERPLQDLLSRVPTGPVSPRRLALA